MDRVRGRQRACQAPCTREESHGGVRVSYAQVPIEQGLRGELEQHTWCFGTTAGFVCRFMLSQPWYPLQYTRNLSIGDIVALYTSSTLYTKRCSSAANLQH